MKFRYYFITCIFLTAYASAGAQNMYDAMNYGRDDALGSARTLGMGNAVTATGGDLGTIYFNPAGSAVAGYSQCSITPVLNVSTATAVGTPLFGTDPYSYGNTLRTNFTTAAIPSIGASLNFSFGRKTGVKSVTVSALTTSSSIFQDKIAAYGAHEGTSLAGYLASQASGIPSSSLDASDAYDNYPTNLVLGWKSGMISTVGSADDVYVGASEKYTEDEQGRRDFFVPGALDQKFNRRSSGYKYDYIINTAVNISDFAFLGVNFATTQLKYDYDEFQAEAAVDPSLFDIDFGDGKKTSFAGLNYSNWYTTRGNGFYFKLGAILTPGPLRVGLAVQTPTWFTLEDTYGASAETNFTDSNFNGRASSPEGKFRYRFTSPWKTSVGLAGTAAGMLLFSADYEVAFNNAMRFDDGSVQNETFSLTNEDIRRCLGTSHTLRAGLEIKPVEAFAIRAGYNMIAVRSGSQAIDGDSYVNVKALTSYSHSASFGLGYSSKGAFFADLGFRALFQPKEYVYPYPDYIFDDAGAVSTYSPEIEVMRKVLFNVALTVGFRF